MKTCPFNNPSFEIHSWQPCPVCGVKSWPYADTAEIDEKCVEGLLGDKKYETSHPTQT